MAGEIRRVTTTIQADGRPPRKRRRRRWIVAIGIVLVVLVVGAVATVGAYVGLSAEPPLALPTAAAAPVGPLDGTWSVPPGSIAGFRIQQTVLGMSGDVVGRTNAVTGTADVAGDEVTGATFSVDLTTVRAAGKASPQFALSLQTEDDPTATITLAQPVRPVTARGSGRRCLAMERDARSERSEGRSRRRMVPSNHRSVRPSGGD